jgi:peptidyl-prolyl cis-trans isomerase D
MKVTDDQLKQQYEEEKSKYVIPEKREVEQLVFPNEAAAKTARAKVDAGTSFEDLIKQQGKTQADASLGTVVQADLAERGPAVFALQEGGVTQPIKAPVGYALLHVVNITPGSSKSFDDAKEELRKEIAAQLAGAKIADLGNSYIDESSRGQSLAQAAAKVGMHVGHIASIDATGHTPDGAKAQIPDDPELLQQMFKADVGDEGDPFIAKSGTTFVVKVEGIRPPELKPLNTIRAEATQGWQKQEVARRLDAKAKELAAKATSEKSLTSIAAQTGATVAKTGALRRPIVNQPVEGPLPAPVLVKVFGVPEGDAVYGPTADGSSFIIARVTGVNHPPAGVVSEMRMKQFATQVGGQAGNDVAQTVAAAARDKQGVTINQKNVDRFTGEEGG